MARLATTNTTTTTSDYYYYYYYYMIDSNKIMIIKKICEMLFNKYLDLFVPIMS